MRTREGVKEDLLRPIGDPDARSAWRSSAWKAGDFGQVELALVTEPHRYSTPILTREPRLCTGWRW
jgi:hypothetical protein